ncbi:hypothetical protein HDU67_005880, partial [Dinochytrium kinnereticum]
PKARELAIISLARLMTTLPSSSLQRVPSLLSQSLSTETTNPRIHGSQQAQILLNDLTRIMYAWQFVAGTKWDALEEAIAEGEEGRSWWKKVLGGSKNTVRVFPGWWEAMSGRIEMEGRGSEELIAIFMEMGLLMLARKNKAPTAKSDAKKPVQIRFAKSLVKEWEARIVRHLERLAQNPSNIDPILHQQALGLIASYLLGPKRTKDLWDYDVDFV